MTFVDGVKVINSKVVLIDFRLLNTNCTLVFLFTRPHFTRRSFPHDRFEGPSTSEISRRRNRTGFFRILPS